MADAKLKIRIGAEDDASKKLNTVNASTQDLKKAFGKLAIAVGIAGGAMVTAATKSLRDWTQLGDTFDKMSQRTGVAVEALSEMRYIAELSGSSIEVLGDAVVKMQRRIEKAGQGLKTYERALDAIGLSYDEVAMLSPEDQFWAIANAIASAEKEQTRILAATELFGVNVGAQLLPLLNQGQEAFVDLRERAHELGITFTEETAKQAAELNDRWTDMSEAINGVKYTVAEELAPAITSLLENQITPAIAGLREWVQQNQDVMQGLLGLVVFVGKAAEFIGKLLSKLTELGRWFSEHKDIWEALGTILPGGRAVFWSEEMQKALFGGMGQETVRATPEAQRLANQYYNNVRVDVGGSVLTDRDLAEKINEVLAEFQHNETFLKETPHGAAYRTSP